MNSFVLFFGPILVCAFASKRSVKAQEKRWKGKRKKNLLWNRFFPLPFFESSSCDAEKEKKKYLF
jgi:hypothetical protein